VGLPACFYLNALSFVAVIIALSRISVLGEVKQKSNGMVKDLLDGLQYIWRESSIFQIITLIAIFSLLGMPFMTLLPIFAGEIFHQGPEGFGIMVGATGAGALLAALSLAFRDDIKDKTRFMTLSALFFSVLLFIFSFTVHFSVAVGILVFIGWSLVSFFAVANSYIQLRVPDNLRGRAMSVYAFVFLGTAPIGNAIIGTAANAVGTTITVAIVATVCLFTSILFCRKICKRQ
jgi:predicted MFS family arabinose efflux permease